MCGGSVVVDFLFIVTPIVGVCNCSMYCCTLLYVHSSIAIILMGKRELIALLNLSSWCLVTVERLFLAVPRGCLQFVIVVFPDHTHLLFLIHLSDFFSTSKFGEKKFRVGGKKLGTVWKPEPHLFFLFGLTDAIRKATDQYGLARMYIRG